MPTKVINELQRSTLFSLMGVVAVGYFLSIAVLGQEQAIEIGNMILFSLAAGVTVTYTPTAYGGIRYVRLDGATVLSMGIWLGWASITYRTGGSILWRFFDKPDGWLDSALWGMHIIGSCCSALCHLLGPEAMNGRVPTKEWVRIGILVAVSVFAAGLLATFNLDPG